MSNRPINHFTKKDSKIKITIKHNDNYDRVIELVQMLRSTIQHVDTLKARNQLLEMSNDTVLAVFDSKCKHNLKINDKIHSLEEKNRQLSNQLNESLITSKLLRDSNTELDKLICKKNSELTITEGVLRSSEAILTPLCSENMRLREEVNTLRSKEQTFLLQLEQLDQAKKNILRLNKSRQKSANYISELKKRIQSSSTHSQRSEHEWIDIQYNLEQSLETATQNNTRLRKRIQNCLQENENENNNDNDDSINERQIKKHKKTYCNFLGIDDSFQLHTHISHHKFFPLLFILCKFETMSQQQPFHLIHTSKSYKDLDVQHEFLTEKEHKFLCSHDITECEDKIKSKTARISKVKSETPDFLLYDRSDRYSDELFRLDHPNESASGILDEQRTETVSLFGDSTNYIVYGRDKFFRPWLDTRNQPVKDWGKKYPNLRKFSTYKKKLEDIETTTGTAETNIEKINNLLDFINQPSFNVPMNLINILNKIVEIPSSEIKKGPNGKKRAKEGETRDKIKSLVCPIKNLKIGTTDRIYISQVERSPGSKFFLIQLYHPIDKKKIDVAVIQTTTGVGKLIKHDYDYDFQINDLIQSLNNMESDPIKFFSEMGKAIGLCCWCGHGLTDDESIKNGFGPTCAKYIRSLKF